MLENRLPAPRAARVLRRVPARGAARCRARCTCAQAQRAKNSSVKDMGESSR